ncbi:hypothetical protein ISG33_11215 [Glaciecola sp. MH2013]|nr:hypothetical protein [Glaciecola sp. MH2013]
MSRKRQHIYIIDDDTYHTIHKFGISSGIINKDGSSRRARGQLPTVRRLFNIKASTGPVIYRNLENRIIALAVEHALVCAYYHANGKQNPEGNKLPKCQVQ